MRWWGVTLAAVALAIAVWAAPTPRISATSSGEETVHALGISSCAARACHGEDEPRPNPIVRSEFSTWIDSDPHTRSLQVLDSSKSNQIARLFGSKKPAKEEPRCLACHAEKLHDHGKMVVESVGCESCHGPASKWLDPHTLGKGWKEKHAAAVQGFVDVNDLAVVARLCVGCHIGSPTSEFGVPRDMNHDMIAAGHPRLNFEFAGYLAQLPVHWNRQKHDNDPQFFARAWAVGQVVSAQAALDLLVHRTNDEKTWPELAEFACYTCHHNLRGEKNWRQERDKSSGQPIWGTWYFGALPALMVDAEARQRLDVLRQAVESRRPPEAIRAAAAKVKLAIDPNRKVDRNAIIAALKDAAANDWDGAAQLYLALAALGAEADRNELRAAWEKLRDPAAFEQSLGKMLESLGQKGRSP